MKYETVIGLEVHAQLLTNSKLFCSCRVKFGSEPNSEVCPICLGMPGVLPVINRRAVEYAVKMALATDCTVNEKSVFSRKNYFYPDLPKGYQVSQFDLPVAEHGHIDIELGDPRKDETEIKRIGITRIHMEEDAGKLIHGEGADDKDISYVDLNRTGTALIEIVSEPDMRNPEEASAYLKTIRDILLYLGICDGNMQEGSFRCDANISIRPVGQKELGTRTELKNMNSFKFIRDALNYEIQRHIDVIEGGEKIIQETRLFDVQKGVTRSMRGKEEAHDYRYHPEPDLLPLIVPNELIEKARGEMPELPTEKKNRFMDEYKLPIYDAGVLTGSKEMAKYFEESLTASCKLSGIPEEEKPKQAKITSNWVMGELTALLKENSLDISECKVTPKSLAELINMVSKDTISGKVAKDVLGEMFSSDKSAEEIVKEKGLVQISDTGELSAVIDKILSDNADSVEKYKAGKTKLMGFFVGEVMKATKGQANPGVASKLIKDKLG